MRHLDIREAAMRGNHANADIDTRCTPWTSQSLRRICQRNVHLDCRSALMSQRVKSANAEAPSFLSAGDEHSVSAVVTNDLSTGNSDHHLAADKTERRANNVHERPQPVTEGGVKTATPQ